jgi:ribosomal protein S18 acetylase RimI-like enzyme
VTPVPGAPPPVRRNGAHRALRKVAAGALGGIQRLRAYRSLARALAPRIEIELAGREECFNVPLAQQRSSKPEGMTVFYLARHGRRITGSARLWHAIERNSPDGAFWVFNVEVRAWCRGFGIGEELVRYIEGEAIAAGATDLTLSVWETNSPAITLYRKLGFEPIVEPALETRLAAARALTGHRSVVMRKTLAQGPATRVAPKAAPV